MAYSKFGHDIAELFKIFFLNLEFNNHNQKIDFTCNLRTLPTGIKQLQGLYWPTNPIWQSFFALLAGAVNSISKIIEFVIKKKQINNYSWVTSLSRLISLKEPIWYWNLWLTTPISFSTLVLESITSLLKFLEFSSVNRTKIKLFEN